MSDAPSVHTREEFERLFRETRDSLSGYLVSRCKDADLAADLFSETYLIAWQKLESIPPGDQAKLWLFGVARNLILKGFRQRRVADALVERLAGELRRVHCEHPQIDDHRQAMLHAALNSLSEGDREILTLTAWEGLTPREIATVMGISANAVRVRLYRARRRVEQRLSRNSATSTAAGCTRARA